MPLYTSRVLGVVLSSGTLFLELWGLGGGPFPLGGDDLIICFKACSQSCQNVQIGNPDVQNLPPFMVPAENKNIILLFQIWGKPIIACILLAKQLTEPHLHIYYHHLHSILFVTKCRIHPSTYFFSIQISATRWTQRDSGKSQLGNHHHRFVEFEGTMMVIKRLHTVFQLFG